MDMAGSFWVGWGWKAKPPPSKLNCIKPCGGNRKKGNIMKLEDIGFYTLSDKRAENVAINYPNVDLQRCELILTDRCNFKCAYCRGLKIGFRGDLPLVEAMRTVDIWAQGNCRNIRLSGGEPTVYTDLEQLVEYIRGYECFEHIAISTNGSADLELYKRLIEKGVNDFSISLDACCAATADMMAGTDSMFTKICQNIKELSKLTYVTVGVVLDERNFQEVEDIIIFASNLGVKDIRIIPSAQYNQNPEITLGATMPILKYRLENLRNGRNLRGLCGGDSCKCHLVKDDMAACGGYHFPCIIYMREQGEPIGKLETGYDSRFAYKRVMEERKKWFDRTDTHLDPICSKNCLDVCVDYNNKVENCVKTTIL